MPSPKDMEFTALILAATSGARLYPLTTTKNDIHSTDTSDAISTYMPKHMLPIAGRPILHHLVDQCQSSGLPRIMIAIGAEDDITQDSLVSGLGCTLQKSNSTIISTLTYYNMDIVMVKMPTECSGSADAFRFVDKQGIVPANSHLIVLPSDLVLYGHLSSSVLNGTNALSSLVDMHRREFRDSKEKGGMPLAMSMVLSDVGEEDENGVPLKESAKVRRR
jgi:translation initiation factor eIF-2B subunit gamma